MTDRRLLKSNGRVAHVSLSGKAEAARFVEGEPIRIVVPLTDLRPAPEPGRRDRQLNFGEGFTVLDRDRDHAFGFCDRDGACGWIEETALGAPVEVTHVLNSVRSYAKMTPDLKSAEPIWLLSHGMRFRIVETSGKWSRFDAPGDGPRWLPSFDLGPLAFDTDPAIIALRYRHTPYLWGGNSAYGIDCSGLVQAAWLACGRACPPDSDLQEAMTGQRVSRDQIERNDLLFWKGHVALALDHQTMVHATEAFMGVVDEMIDTAIARIGPPTSILRWSA
jgi:hypothetical protein